MARDEDFHAEHETGGTIVGWHVIGGERIPVFHDWETTMYSHSGHSPYKDADADNPIYSAALRGYEDHRD